MPDAVSVAAPRKGVYTVRKILVRKEKLSQIYTLNAEKTCIGGLEANMT